MKFGNNLKKLRKKMHLSQEELALKINVTRQSISKWETGDAYPEMNHLLELCKIFDCHINDLVHKDMQDIQEFDEKVIQNIQKFDEEKQENIKSLSHIISLIGKIGSIVLKVAIPFVIIAMLFIPYIVNNVEIENNTITFKTEHIKKLDENKVEVFQFMLIDLEDMKEEELVQILQENIKMEIILSIELGLATLIINLIIMIYILTSVEKLFYNIKNTITPFTLENVVFIKKIAYSMIVLIFVSPVTEMIFAGILNRESQDSFIDLIQVLEILILFSMSYIFEYGYEIQKDSKGRMLN